MYILAHFAVAGVSLTFFLTKTFVAVGRDLDPGDCSRVGGGRNTIRRRPGFCSRYLWINVVRVVVQVKIIDNDSVGSEDSDRSTVAGVTIRVVGRDLGELQLGAS